MSALQSLGTSMKRSLIRSMCGLVIGAVASAAMAVVPTPQVTGPIPFAALGTADHNYPFLATDMNLASRGYVEEEFFYSGTANRYNAQSPNATGPAPTANLRDITEAYYFTAPQLLLARLDKATRLLAEGYIAAAQSDAVTKNAKFKTAVQSLELYINDVAKLPSQGRGEKLITDMLVDWTDILIDAIEAEAGTP